ncbi:MAG: translesion DNA synthesis-associated protein ImuA [Comamonas sp.]|uniref:translesion DNA synthesis-associated protein ImuA n=1 Tax=Comamonas sp. TaxID=34028 RepID=UPI0028374E04|nr:translesion DNA synthesis-associated protein ImuA [Comamonas sp.]MDR0214704.1 translesion DNA synthesis-associated protein ImuA [Comamonas sp.]
MPQQTHTFTHRADPQALRCAARLQEVQLDGVWRGSDWHEGCMQQTWPSGHAALDAELPGGGWPSNALVQIQQAPHTHAEWALLLPALAAQAGRHEGQLVLVAPPFLPFSPALQAAGIAPQRLCCVQAPQRSAQELAWACEQALHCRDVLAVLAWLPQLAIPSQRRLQLAAASQGRPLWLWQGLQAGQHSSPAALRLRLERAPQTGAADGLQIQILKRRGPALVSPVQLSLAQWAWMPVLQAQAARHARQSEEAALLMQGRAMSHALGAAPIMVD